MCDPRGGDVIKGTGGVRKLRFSPTGWNFGKSGALRVCYVYFEKYGNVFLCTTYKKGDMQDLSENTKKALKAAMLRIETELIRIYGF